MWKWVCEPQEDRIFLKVRVGDSHFLLCTIQGVLERPPKCGKKGKSENVEDLGIVPEVQHMVYRIHQGEARQGKLTSEDWSTRWNVVP